MGYGIPRALPRLFLRTTGIWHGLGSILVDFRFSIFSLGRTKTCQSLQTAALLPHEGLTNGEGGRGQETSAIRRGPAPGVPTR